MDWEWDSLPMPLTVICMSGEVLGINDEVVVCVQLPELTVDHIEVLVGEIVGHLMNREREAHCEMSHEGGMTDW